MKQFWGTITRSTETFKAKDHAKAFNIKRRVATLDTTVISVKDARVNCGFFSCFVTWRRRWRVLRGHQHWRDRCDVHAGTLSSSLGAVCRLNTPRARVRSTPPTSLSTWFLVSGPVSPSPVVGHDHVGLVPVDRACCALECLLLESLSVGHGKKPKNSFRVRDCLQVSTMLLESYNAAW